MITIFRIISNNNKSKFVRCKTKYFYKTNNNHFQKFSKNHNL